MTGRLTETEDATGQEAAPLCLDSIIRTGATFQGRRLLRAVLIFDGGKMSVDMPEDTSDRLINSQLAAKILAKLQESDTPLTRKQLAQKLKTGLGGWFSPTVAALVAKGKIFEQDRELTDDASKYEIAGSDE